MEKNSELICGLHRNSLSYCTLQQWSKCLCSFCIGSKIDKVKKRLFSCSFSMLFLSFSMLFLMWVYFIFYYFSSLTKWQRYMYRQRSLIPILHLVRWSISSFFSWQLSHFCAFLMLLIHLFERIFCAGYPNIMLYRRT